MRAYLAKQIRHFLPEWVYRQLVGQWDTQGFKRYFTNTSWMAAGRLAAMVVSFVTLAVVARYLGPENYGKLSYAQSFVAIFSVFASLGIDQIIYRNLIAEPHREAEWLGSAVAVKFVLGFLTLIVTVVTSLFIADEPILTWLIVLVALAFIFQPLSTVGHVFNAEVKAKYSTYATLAVAILIPTLKLVVIFFDRGIIYFAALITFEALLYALINMTIYIRVFKRNPGDWRYSLGHSRRLLYDAWPLALASLSGYIYGRIDQIMIQDFIDSRAVGLYDTAVRLTELIGFFPGVLIGSLLPAIVGAKQRAVYEYRRRWRALSWLCLSIATTLAFGLYITAPLIIGLLYGSEFAESTTLLRLYVWSIIGTVGVILAQQYLITEHRSRLFLIYSLLGATTNVILNYLLIPKYGMAGAAIATLITLTTVLAIFVIVEWIVNRTPNLTT